MTRPQGSTLPAITFQKISEGREQNLKGFEGLQQSRVQMDVWANSYVEAEAVMDAAIAALAPADVEGGTVFSRTMFEGVRDFLERLDTKDIYRKSVDLIVSHQPA